MFIFIIKYLQVELIYEVIIMVVYRRNVYLGKLDHVIVLIRVFSIEMKKSRNKDLIVYSFGVNLIRKCLIFVHLHRRDS
jgi:hypothetical protein